MSGLTKLSHSLESVAAVRRTVLQAKVSWEAIGQEKTADIVSKILAAPVRAAGRGVKNVLFGRVATAGPFRGLRMVAAKGSKAWAPVSEKAFLQIQSGARRGQAVRVATKGGDTFLERQFHPGGLVGWAKRKPLHAAAAAGGTYLLATSPSAREMAKGFIPKGEANTISPEVEATFAPQPPSVSPFAKNTWKPTNIPTVPK